MEEMNEGQLKMDNYEIVDNHCLDEEMIKRIKERVEEDWEEVKQFLDLRE